MDFSRVQKRVLAVGDVNMDVVFTGLAGMPVPEQETLAQGMDIVVGGQAGTIARALARLGWGVTFVGRVGDDDFGRQARHALVAAGVDIGGVVVDPALRSGATVVLSTGAKRAFATFPGSISEVRLSDVTPALLSRADHLHVGSFFLLTALRPDMRKLLREARRRGLTTSMDPGWDPSGEWGDDIRATLPFVDVFLPNEAEAMAITATRTPEKALAALSGVARTVVVKRGAEGCLAGNGNTALRCPAFKVKAVDVTSAGDIFNAGFLHGFLHGWDLGESVKFAGACGAMSVSRAGSAGIMTGVEQVQEFLAARGSEINVRAIPTRGQV
jgi:sugar/nucleoside kinase (ribokinase family)